MESRPGQNRKVNIYKEIYGNVCTSGHQGCQNDRKRAMDELPQSAEGKTIMTTEPKFIPKEAVKINLFDGNDIKVRMVDCVGYIVEDAGGLMEGERERMVMTPWSEEPMPLQRLLSMERKK